MCKIFSNYGIEVFEINCNYYLEYDCGEITVITDRIPISKEEAEEAMTSSESAYDVIIRFLNIEMGEINLWYKKAKEDGIDVSKDEFVRKHHSKEINIYYIENNSFIPFYGEVSGNTQYDFLIEGETRYITKRYYMKTGVRHITDKNLQLEIQNRLLQYLKDEKIRHDINIGL